MIKQNDAVLEGILVSAKQICAAAVTAPKACGRDSIVTAIVHGEELKTLAEEMRRIESERPEGKKPIFRRDADFVERSGAVVLIGCTREPRGLDKCSLCGYANCGKTVAAGGHCIFDDIDLGVALGSAAAMAADLRLDNRILYTAGMAAKCLGLLGEDVEAIMGLPLSAHARNQFFLRE